MFVLMLGISSYDHAKNCNLEVVRSVHFSLLVVKMFPICTILGSLSVPKLIN